MFPFLHHICMRESLLFSSCAACTADWYARLGALPTFRNVSCPVYLWTEHTYQLVPLDTVGWSHTFHRLSILSVSFFQSNFLFWTLICLRTVDITRDTFRFVLFFKILLSMKLHTSKAGSCWQLKSTIQGEKEEEEKKMILFPKRIPTTHFALHGIHEAKYMLTIFLFCPCSHLCWENIKKFFWEWIAFNNVLLKTQNLSQKFQRSWLILSWWCLKHLSTKIGPKPLRLVFIRMHSALY